MNIDRTAFTKPIKRFIQRQLADLGYVLIKKVDFDRMYTPAVAAEMDKHASYGQRRLNLSRVKTRDPDFRRFYESIEGICILSPARVEAVYFALRALQDSDVPGDIVESGAMSIQSLILIGAALNSFRATTRRLVLLDVAVDPLFRAEPELTSWGANEETRPSPALRRDRISAGACRIIPELIASGYPSENIAMIRYPEDTALFSGPIAFLGVTSQTYPANRAAIGELYPRISAGGIIAVEDEGLKARKRDAVAEYLDNQGIVLQFSRVTATYRIGAKSSASDGRP